MNQEGKPGRGGDDESDGNGTGPPSFTYYFEEEAGTQDGPAPPCAHHGKQDVTNGVHDVRVPGSFQGWERGRFLWPGCRKTAAVGESFCWGIIW